MNNHDAQLVELLKHMHAMCSVRVVDHRMLLQQLANKALDAGFWSEAFRVFLYDNGSTVADMQLTLASHVEELGGVIENIDEHIRLIETTYYITKMLNDQEDVLSIAHYVLVDLDDHELQGGPPYLHIHDLAMEYYQWCFDSADWMQGDELATERHKTINNLKELAQHWLDHYAIASPFDRL